MLRMEKIKGKTMNTSFTKLSINSQVSRSPKQVEDKRSVADSWEDETISPPSETECPLSPQAPDKFPSAPPPTPIYQTISLSHDNFPGHDDKISDYVRDISNERGITRPEKTDAVARRMIAGALGMRTPEKTEEQKAYEKAIKEKEIKRLKLEKEAQTRAREKAELARQAVWND